ncbi:MAG TPA: DUF1697 domain-containing protein [Candidatus Dormibacteraeota bacterium]|nr:DUF1697 domain-containing protein [Candidatus Dormibacteraeota bacterium]
MARHVVLLRGVNLVRTNRIAMVELRAALDSAGFHDVKTYVQSGNVVLTSKASPERVAADVHALIKERFGFDIAVVVRSADELARVVRRNPLGAVAVDPKHYLVTFLSGELPVAVIERLRSAAAPQERLAVHGCEIYSWHPVGVGRSPLWERIAARSLGVVATSRNWATVTTLLAMAEESADR